MKYFKVKGGKPVADYDERWFDLPHITKHSHAKQKHVCNNCGKKLEFQVDAITCDGKDMYRFLRKVKAKAWVNVAVDEESGKAFCIDVWCGDFAGILVDHKSKVPAFCSDTCLSSFGAALYKKGYRRVKKKDAIYSDYSLAELTAVNSESRKGDMTAILDKLNVVDDWLDVILRQVWSTLLLPLAKERKWKYFVDRSERCWKLGPLPQNKRLWYKQAISSRVDVKDKNDSELVRLVDWLSVPVTLSHNSELGMLLPNYDPEEEVNNYVRQF